MQHVDLHGSEKHNKRAICTSNKRGRTEGGNTPGWVLLAVFSAVIVLSVSFLKSNSTKGVQRVQVPIKIGLVYIQGTMCCAYISGVHRY